MAVFIIETDSLGKQSLVHEDGHGQVRITINLFVRTYFICRLRVFMLDKKLYSFILAGRIVDSSEPYFLALYTQQATFQMRRIHNRSVPFKSITLQRKK